MAQHENVYRGTKKMVYHNFLGGIAWGLGASFGASIFLALIAFFLSQVDFVPIVGDFFQQVSEYIQSRPRTPDLP